MESDFIICRDRLVECIKQRRDLCFEDAQALMADQKRWFAFLETACECEHEIDMIALCLENSSTLGDALFITGFLFRMIDLYKAEKFHKVMQG